MTIDKCRACGSDDLRLVIELGPQYLSDFRTDSLKPPRYPLDVVLCGGCTLAQLTVTAPAQEMYHQNYSFKSGVNQAIANDLASVVDTALNYVTVADSWLDIASNDGTLLSFVPAEFERYGIDPLPQFATEAREHGKIITDFFKPGHFKGQKFGVITAVSMFYDLDDPNEFVAGVASVLDNDGVWIIQQNYLPKMLARNSFDNISHEHVCYYNLTALEQLLSRHNLEVISFEESEINGGCMRTVVAHKDVYEREQSVSNQLAWESKVHWQNRFERFKISMNETIEKLQDLVFTAHDQGETIYVYGASTRGGTIWQACGFDGDVLPRTVERNPDKVGKVFSCIGSPIISEEQARASMPDYLLIGPWWFADQFAEREQTYLDNGGALIVPLPEVRVIKR